MTGRVDRRWLWIGLLLVVVVAAFLGSSRRRSGPPFDPTSTDADGARALVVLLEDLGASVDVTDEVPDPDDGGTVLVLDDRMPNEQADRVTEYARDGGTVVVADESSLLSPPSRPVDAMTIGGSCADGSLSEVDDLSVRASARVFQVGNEPSVIACFVVDGHAFVVSEPAGAGHIISVGDPGVFTNELLGEADNAVLAVALIGGDDRELTFLTPAATEVGTGDRSLADLVPDSVKALGWQALVVFGFAVWWRARRLGAPVTEPQPVTIAGSELTRAVGRLLENNRRPDRAAALLRDRARVELAPRLGLSPDASAAAVAVALANTTTLTPEDIHLATVEPISTDEQLLFAARLLSRIREEVLHGTQKPR